MNRVWWIAAIVLFVWAVPLGAQPFTSEIAKSVVPFRGSVQYRDGSTTVAATAVIVKKIQQVDRTVLYVTVPPGPVLGSNELVVQGATKFILLKEFEFPLEVSGKICWSAETVPLKAVIYREGQVYLPTIYEGLTGPVQEVRAWQGGNAYPAAGEKYWVVGYDFSGDVWELVRIKAVYEEVKYLGADTRVPRPNETLSGPSITLKFQAKDANRVGTAGNVIVDEKGVLIAIVLDVAGRAPSLYVTAVPAQVVFECLNTFFSQAKIPFP
ncbi:MAG: hypothetical protein HYS57_01750 [Parcubacteria group bacterium]|nr:hypothetical protein [Parcubacteria group bacterium]